jgi:hypothetical protein
MMLIVSFSFPVVDAVPPVRRAGAAFAVCAVVKWEAGALAPVLLVLGLEPINVNPVRAAAVAMHDRLYTFCSCFPARFALAAIAHVLG